MGFFYEPPSLAWFELEDWPNAFISVWLPAEKKKQSSCIFFDVLEAKLEQVGACEGIKQHMLVQWDYKFSCLHQKAWVVVIWVAHDQVQHSLHWPGVEIL